MLSNLFQRLQVVMLIASRSAHKLPNITNTMVLHTLTTRVSTNVVSNVNASTQQSKLTGEASNTKRSPKKNTENPSPNSLRKNVPSWLILSKLMKNHKNLFEHFAFHIISKNHIL